MIEDVTTEFKREYVDDIKKTITAFANTKGGTLYVGIADDGTAIGIANVPETMIRLTNMIRDSIRPDVTLFVQYAVEKIDCQEVVKVTVQKGCAAPYYIAGKGIRPEGVYVRHGASSVPASESAILQMIKSTDGEKYDETRALNQELTFEYAENEFSARKMPFGVNQQKTLKLLSNTGIYTNLALLLSDQCVHTIKVAVFDGSVKEIFKDRREFSGSLLKQLNEVFAFIDRYNSVHAQFEGLHRRDNRDYPEEAVREALLNSLVHREYSFSASTIISIFSDRIEFASIGGLVAGISLEDVMLGISVSRNENLADVFYRLELIEAYGTGMPRIIRSYDGYSVKPRIEATENAFRITLPNSNSARESETPLYQNEYEKNEQHGLEMREAEPVYFTENEQCVLRLFDTLPFVARKDVEAALAVSQAMAVRVLRTLLDKGAIYTVGDGKNTRYRIFRQ